MSTKVGMVWIPRSERIVPAASYPNLARLAGAMVSGGSDQQFGFGVNLLIAGFAAQIPAS